MHKIPGLVAVALCCNAAAAELSDESTLAPVVVTAIRRRPGVRSRSHR